MADESGTRSDADVQKARKAAQKGDAGAAEVQQRVDKENEQGFVGVEVDPTPNENYTVEGVISDAPTPETDADAAAEARKAREGVRER